MDQSDIFLAMTLLICDFVVLIVFDCIPAHFMRVLLCTCGHVEPMVKLTLPWRHNGRDRVSNHQPRDCFLNRLFRHRSKKTSKLRVTGLCAGNSPEAGEFPAQMASNAENVSIGWRHHEGSGAPPLLTNQGYYPNWNPHQASRITRLNNYIHSLRFVLFCRGLVSVNLSISFRVTLLAQGKIKK